MFIKHLRSAEHGEKATTVHISHHGRALCLVGDHVARRYLKVTQMVSKNAVALLFTVHALSINEFQSMRST